MARHLDWVHADPSTGSGRRGWILTAKLALFVALGFVRFVGESRPSRWVEPPGRACRDPVETSCRYPAKSVRDFPGKVRRDLRELLGVSKYSQFPYRKDRWKCQIVIVETVEMLFSL
jgi:hypothetical protein